jgi:hypothetical protein
MEPFYLSQHRTKIDKSSARRQLVKLRIAFLGWLLSALVYFIWCFFFC